jgi:hypothetical protein
MKKHDEKFLSLTLDDLRRGILLCLELEAFIRRAFDRPLASDEKNAFRWIAKAVETPMICSQCAALSPTELQTFGILLTRFQLATAGHERPLDGQLAKELRLAGLADEEKRGPLHIARPRRIPRVHKTWFQAGHVSQE